jgi:hypothetical protein
VNHFLARAVAVLNGLIAIILIGVGAFVGVFSRNPLGLILGVMAGFIAALVLCGILALAIQIHAELIKIRVALERAGRERSSA